MSRFESNLLKAINAEVSATRRAVLRLAWAAYRVRVGDAFAARGVVSEIRSQYSNHYDAQIFAHINFVEGLCEFFEGGIEPALPKLLRAHALSRGCPAGDDLPVLIKAWLASFYRSLGNWRGLGDLLTTAISCSDSFSDEVRWRLSLVTADAFQEIESYAEATRWYSTAHQYALAAGDDAALSAILYNRAAIRVFNERIREVSEGSIDISEGRIALEAASAKNYTQYIKDSSMQWGFDLMAGQLLLLQGDYVQALALLDSEGVRNLERQWPAVDLVRRADVFRCRAVLGKIDYIDGGPDADRIWSRSELIAGSGDRAIAAYSLAVGLGKFDNNTSLSFRETARTALSLFTEERRREAVELDHFVSVSGSQVKSMLSAVPSRS